MSSNNIGCIEPLSPHNRLPGDGPATVPTKTVRSHVIPTLNTFTYVLPQIITSCLHELYYNSSALAWSRFDLRLCESVCRLSEFQSLHSFRSIEYSF